MVAFILRAVLSGSATAGNSLGLFIAQQVIYSIGFFGLLYSAYTLVLDRYVDRPLICDLQDSYCGVRSDMLLNGVDIHSRGLLGRLVYLFRRTRVPIRIILLSAIVMGIVGGVSAQPALEAEGGKADMRRRAKSPVRTRAAGKTSAGPACTSSLASRVCLR